MRVAIVVPRSLNKKQLYKEYPLGAGYIGTILHNMGNEVRIYDQNIELFDNLDLVYEIKRYNPDIIGFSIITATYPNSINIIEMIRKEKIEAPIFAGGIHPTIFPIECLNGGVDYVIKGEGEIPIEKLIKYFEGKISLDKVPNVAYKINGEVNDKPMKLLELDINKLPIINRDLFNIKMYDMHSISGTRGCPFSCKFCCNYNHLTDSSFKKRLRSVESIVEEIKYLQTKYNARKFFFVDDVFFTDINNLREFNRCIRSNSIKINYNAQLRVNMINDEVCQLLNESGCVKIEVGVESGSEKILKDACKGISIENVIKGIEISKKNNLRIKTNWIYGLPGNLEEQYKSIDLMLKTMPNEISIHQLIPFPGTEYYDNREKYGICIKNSKNFESFCYGDLDDNITYEYMSKEQYKKLIYDTISELEKVGYVSSDKSSVDSEYVYTTPFDKLSLEAVRD